MSASSPLILVVDDEKPLRRFLRASLEGRDHRVLEAETGQEALTLTASHSPDAIILDLGLPDLDGLVVTRRIREWSHVPILVVSARGQTDDKVAALDAGANDYLTKPFDNAELLARLRVALRPRQQLGEGPAQATFDVGPLHVDLGRHEVSRDGVLLHLTPTEFKLLATLARHAGKVLTHRQLLKEVWGVTSDSQAHTVRVHMAELRRKIEPEPARPRWLVTETGIGYRLRDRES